MIKTGGSVTTKHQESIRKQDQGLKSLLLKARRDPIRGFISAIKPGDSSGNDYYYEVRVTPNISSEEEASYKGFIALADMWMPLAEDPAVIALLYGDKEMILQSRCRVEFSSATPDTGIVFIEFDPKRRKLRKRATEFDKKAFLYATAGEGKLI
jgi:hypothetical protein